MSKALMGKAVSPLTACGFSCTLLVRQMRRPVDHAFGQMNLLFAPSGDAFFSSNNYPPQEGLR